MKKNYKVITLGLFIICIIAALFIIKKDGIKDSFKGEDKKSDEVLLVIDANKTSELPSRFRVIEKFNMSGSAQFQPSQINNIKERINKNDIYIIDLRQESHGFINDFAVSYYNPSKTLNEGFDSNKTLSKSKELFEQIPVGDEINLYGKSGKVEDRAVVQTVSLEDDLVTNAGMKYKLFAVKDGGIPTPIMVDNFVDFVKFMPSEAHLHFHCDAGEGRTTMFMALYQMMKNTENESLEGILSEQVNAGGIDLTSKTERAQFLKDFYAYVTENKSSNYEKIYSEWIATKK